MWLLLQCSMAMCVLFGPNLGPARVRVFSHVCLLGPSISPAIISDCALFICWVALLLGN